MSEKMTDRNRFIIVNAAIVVGLIWCGFMGYPPKIILVCGIFLLAFANALMRLRRKRSASPS